MSSSWSLSLTKMIENVGEGMSWSLDKISHFTVGQVLIKFIDRGLNVVEKTAQWSLPYSEIVAEENGKAFKIMELVRPLPWIFFLPSLVILRSFRLMWNIGAWILGYPPIQPSDIVKCLQKSRRRLRVIRLNGSKRMRKTNSTLRDKSLRINEAKRSLLKSIQIVLSSLSCLDAGKMKSSPSTRIRLHDDQETEPTPVTEPLIANLHGDPKRKYSEVSSDYSQSSDESDAEYERFKSKLNPNLSAYGSEDEEDKSFKINVDENEKSDGSDEEIPSNDEEETQKELEELMGEDESAKSIVYDVGDDTEQKFMVQHGFMIKKKKVNGNENVISKNSDDSQDYYSPKSIEDGETAFYSPLSSKSSSPEPSVNDADRQFFGTKNSKTAVTETRITETIKSCEQIEENNKNITESTDTQKIKPTASPPKPILSHGKIYRHKRSTGSQSRSSNERGKKK
ncbi:uncharacterized protein LOC103568278 isoform X2 [Microplitis demolitor]|uniref:uncharacterized protein LOC103568278 isoform X2 n=1 Tax=Microplitis demolitor TaxID=69319 RepID=UPI0004CDCBDF|nr:uncharacterized protein LOC103568278 isoform X2 [Microplitis demolitor]